MMTRSPLPAALVRFSFVVALLAGLVNLTGCQPDVSDTDIEIISLNEFRSLTEGKNASQVMIVDPRSERDFEAGHIPGAQNYGLNSERAKAGTGLNPVFSGYKHLVVYGDDPGSGPGKAMSKRLMMLKAKNVKFFAGGLIEWRRAGLRVETGKGGATAAGAETEKKSGTLAK